LLINGLIGNLLLHKIICLNKSLKTEAMKNKILLVVSILFGLMFINSGLNKFFNYMPMPKDMPENMVKLITAFMEISWLMPLIAVAEIVGGALFMTNRYRALGAIIIFPVMVGILLTHIIYAPSGLPLALVLLAINIWVIIENREKYLPMIK
jgi:putative oxidoreductase